MQKHLALLYTLSWLLLLTPALAQQPHLVHRRASNQVAQVRARYDGELVVPTPAAVSDPDLEEREVQIFNETAISIAKAALAASVSSAERSTSTSLILQYTPEEKQGVGFVNETAESIALAASAAIAEGAHSTSAPTSSASPIIKYFTPEDEGGVGLVNETAESLAAAAAAAGSASGGGQS